MQCKEATSLIIPFIERELPEDKLKIFLEHIRNCKECREELEIYYTIHMYIEGIDRDWFSTYNFKGEFEKELKEKGNQLRHMLDMKAVQESNFKLTGKKILR